MKIPPQVIVGCGYLTDVIISLSMGSAGKDKAPPPVRFRKEGRVAPESSVLDVLRISRVLLYKVCKSRRYKLKLVEVWIASGLPHQYPLQMACGPVQVGQRGIRSAPRPYTGSGDKPSFSRRSLWVNLKPCRKRDEADNIRKRTGIIGSNPIVAAVLPFIIRFSIAIRWEGMGHTGRKQNPH